MSLGLGGGWVGGGRGLGQLSWRRLCPAAALPAAWWWAASSASAASAGVFNLRSQEKSNGCSYMILKFAKKSC